jgi:hypothetical protein
VGIVAVVCATTADRFAAEGKVGANSCVGLCRLLSSAGRAGRDDTRVRAIAAAERKEGRGELLGQTRKSTGRKEETSKKQQQQESRILRKAAGFGLCHEKLGKEKSNR